MGACCLLTVGVRVISEKMKCDKCKRFLDDGEEIEFCSKMLCDDCYIDGIQPKVRKEYYENNPGEFMQRLKNAYSMHPQKYH